MNGIRFFEKISMTMRHRNYILNCYEACLRMIPLGGYVMIAGEDVEDEDVPADRQMCNKGFLPRFFVLFAGTSSFSC